MILTITLSISTLLIINFILLKFSCNKVAKKTTVDKKPIVFTPEVNITDNKQERLAPTGS